MTVEGFLCLVHLVFLEVLDESMNGRTGAPGLFVSVLEFGHGYAVLVQSDIEFTLHFRTCAFGVAQEPDKLRIGVGIEALGNIVHGRSGSILDLSFQPVSLLEARLPGQAVGLAGQFARQFPCLNILKPLNLHNPSEL